MKMWVLRLLSKTVQIIFRYISFKVEKILKGSLDLFKSPSTSVKIQNYEQKSLLEV